jgi:hypothetical protein
MVDRDEHLVHGHLMIAIGVEDAAGRQSKCAERHARAADDLVDCDVTVSATVAIAHLLSEYRLHAQQQTQRSYRRAKPA